MRKKYDTNCDRTLDAVRNYRWNSISIVGPYSINNILGRPYKNNKKEIINMAKISFDFDGTLARETIQRYATELIDRGHEVCIITSRLKSPRAPYGLKMMVDNEDLYEVADRLGITDINFTNLQSKVETVKAKDIDLHLDDCSFELQEIASDPDCKAAGVSVWRTPNWRNKCEKVLRRLQ
jgi:hypothetical protein